MQVGSRVNAWFRVAVALIVGFAIIGPPRRHMAGHAPPKPLRKNHGVAKLRRVRALSQHDAAGTALRVQANSGTGSPDRRTSRLTASAWPPVARFRAPRRRGRPAAGPAHAATPLRC